MCYLKNSFLVLLFLATVANAYSRGDYFLIVLSVGGKRYSAEGSIAGYSNTSFTEVSGPLYNANEEFGCAEQNETTRISPPFVLFAPLSDNCGDYEKALAAQRLGAAAIIFYYSDSSKRFSSGAFPDLKVAVTRIRVSSNNKVANDLSRGSTAEVQPISVRGSAVLTTVYLRKGYQGHTFYFVVFAFSLLIVLSLTWFIVSYTKRMCGECARRRRRVSLLSAVSWFDECPQSSLPYQS